jgi:hypothetical protein
MRIALTSIFLLPYLYYGLRDSWFHFVGREVSPVEHMLHLLVGITMASSIICAFRGRAVLFVAGIVLFLLVGAADEYIFHKHLPEAESDLHAKGHLALLIFVVVALSSMWLEGHRWQLSNIH